jgi:hypothetical protein
MMIYSFLKVDGMATQVIYFLLKNSITKILNNNTNVNINQL